MIDDSNPLLCCPACSTKVCWSCLTGYMAAQAVMPACSKRECGQVFDEIFLMKGLSDKFRVTIRQHVRRVLADQAQARLPDIMERIEARGGSKYMLPSSNLHALKKAKAELRCQQQDLKNQLSRLRDGKRKNFVMTPAMEQLQMEIDQLQRRLAIDPAEVTYFDYKGQPISEAEYQRQKAQHSSVGKTAKTATKGPRPVFPCGRTGTTDGAASSTATSTPCPGMLNARWRCILCRGKRCRDCHLHYEGSKKEHTCKPEDVATAKLILQDSKPCPKCGERISRVHGCDHMWCTQCETGFNYSTGAVLTGHNTNPHYQQWRREKEAAGLAPVATYRTGCEPTTRLVEQDPLYCKLFCLGLSMAEVALVSDFYRLSDPEARHMLGEYSNETYLDLLERRLLGQVPDKTFSECLFRDYRKRERHTHHRKILQTLAVAGEEILGLLMQASDKETARALVGSIVELRRYLNRQFQEINQGLGYNNWPHISLYFEYEGPGFAPRFGQGWDAATRYASLLPLRETMSHFGLDKVADPEAQLRFIVEILSTGQVRAVDRAAVRVNYHYQSML